MVAEVSNESTKEIYFHMDVVIALNFIKVWWLKRGVTLRPLNLSEQTCGSKMIL